MSEPLWPAPTDEELAARYLAQPSGPYSPEVQALLTRVLRRAAAERLIVVTLIPFQRWALARLPKERGERIVIEHDAYFASETEAEKALFRRCFRQQA